MSEPASRVWVIFSEALEMGDPGTRAAYLQAACGGDEDLIREIEELLQADTKAAAGFLPERVRQSEPKPAFEAEQAEAWLSERIGAYKLIEKLGEGGCGVVYLAQQEEPVRRKVALKLIRPGMDTKRVIARFEAERQALALMDHPWIAKVFDAGTTQTGHPFFAMELVPGMKLTRFCNERQFSVRQRLELFLRVCQAVQHAHQKGVIHRDLKPSNILVSDQDGEAVPKIIDFGIAKATQGPASMDLTSVTGFEQLVGTPAYMSPEQAAFSGVNMDTRSDIYSLGVVLYELVTGLTPFDNKRLQQASFEELQRIIGDEEPPRPSAKYQHLNEGDQLRVASEHGSEPGKLLRLIRGDLEWVIMKSLEKDPNRRYPTVNGLASDIQRYLRNEPILARPPNQLYRLRKVAQRHKTAFAAGAAVLSALVLGLALSLAEAGRATRAEAAEAQHRQAAEEAQRQAEANRTLLAHVLNEVELQRVEDFFNAGDSSKALAYLASLLRLEPDNEIAAERLFSALTMRDLPLRLAPPLVHHSRVLDARFSPDGNRVATSSDDGTVQIWDAHSGQPMLPPLRHQSRVWSAEFSPDGGLLVTASNDRTAQIWDARTGRRAAPALTHSDYVSGAHFSPDGKWVVTASDDHTARIWDARTGEPAGPPLRHSDHVSSASFSFDSRFVVTSCDDGTARVWDSLSGQAVTAPLKHEARVWTAQFSPAARWVVTASDDKTARIWDVSTGRLVTEPLRQGGAIYSAKFSPDGLRVVTACEDGSAQLWNALTGKALGSPLHHEGKVRSAEFSADGQKVVTTSDDRTARIWDGFSGQELSEPLRHEAIVRFAQFSPDGMQIVTASEDQTAQLWDAQNDQILSEPMTHTDRLRDARFSPQGDRIVTASEDDSARVWETRTSRPVTDRLKHDAAVTCACFSPDGLQVATGSEDGAARLWNASTGQSLSQQMKHGGKLYTVEFSPDGQRLLTVAEDGEARVWELLPIPRVTLRLKHGGTVVFARFSPDGGQVLTGAADGSARLWDARTGQSLVDLKEHTDAIVIGAFSPDATTVATACHDKAARVWDSRTGQRLCRIQHRDQVCSVEFSPDGKRIVTASWDGTARIWDARTGQPLTEPLEHHGRVVCARFSSDGSRVVTGSDDGSARVWDSLTGQPLTEPLKHTDRVRSAAFSPDGQRVLTASEDGTARVWDVPARLAPVPQWVTELTEQLIGIRVNEHRVLEPVPFNRLPLLHAQAAAAGGTIWTQWAAWFLADPLTHRISPFSDITITDYVAHRIQQNTPGSLLEAVRIAPTNGLALLRFASLRLSSDPPASGSQLGEAEWYSARAIQFAPTLAEAWAVRARVLLRAGNTSAALQASERALQLEPRNPLLWITKAAMLEEDNRLDDAFQSLTSAIELAKVPPWSETNLVARVRLVRSAFLRRQNRSEEAAADFCLAKRIQARPAQASNKQVDLTLFYNACLNESWHSGGEGNDLSSLPLGLQTFKGVTFDIRGLIQVGAESVAGEKYPSEIHSIQVGQNCARLHFLHSAVYCFGLTKGTQIGAYRVHCKGGTVYDIPIVIGRDIADWWNQPNEQNEEFVVAWEGTNERTRKLGRTIRVFESSWNNPTPELEVESFDFLSTYERAAPFLIAVTTE